MNLLGVARAACQIKHWARARQVPLHLSGQDSPTSRLRLIPPPRRTNPASMTRGMLWRELQAHHALRRGGLKIPLWRELQARQALRRGGLEKPLLQARQVLRRAGLKKIWWRELQAHQLEMPLWRELQAHQLEMPLRRELQAWGLRRSLR